jgi:hypothetical protein
MEQTRIVYAASLKKGDYVKIAGSAPGFSTAANFVAVKSRSWIDFHVLTVEFDTAPMTEAFVSNKRVNLVAYVVLGENDEVEILV